MCSKILYVLFSVMFFVSNVSMYSYKEGFPAGYLENCPGFNKPAVITKNNLKYVALTVQGPGNVATSRRIRYSYNYTNKLAKDPNLKYIRRTVLYIGGYLDSPNFIFARKLGRIYNKLDYNVLHLDINRLGTIPFPISARFMRPVAVLAAEMLVNLTREGVINPKTIEIIGLSLGAHTMSFVAKHFRKLTGQNITTLIGLDPSGPCHRNEGPENRLDASDADFVNVVHTNIDNLGMAAPIGHVNFYVNGGEYQMGEHLWAPCDQFCCHVRSYWLWLATLEHPNEFIGIKCDSIQQARERNCYDQNPMVTNKLGRKTDRNNHGIFYLSTRNKYPFFMGKNGTRKENDFDLNFITKFNEPDMIYF